MATILIVEDEILIADEIHRALVRLGHSPLPPVDNSDDALDALAEHPVELVLMDINIAGDCDGIATAIQVRRKFAVPVVFVTARSDSSTLKRANVAQPYAFINKPFTDATLQVQLELALLKAYDSPPPRPFPRDSDEPPAPLGAPDSSGKSMFVRQGQKWIRYLYTDILYFESDARYVFLQRGQERILIAEPLRKLEMTLPPIFMRIHKSYLVNLDHVEVLDDAYVDVAGQQIPVGRAFKAELKNRLISNS